MEIYENILAEYNSHRNQGRAIPMTKYMRSRFLFLGIPRPERNRLQADFLLEVRRVQQINWDFVYECWQMPEREYQYLAVDYLLVLVNSLQEEDMSRLQFLINTRSWWDTVDIIAVKLVGGLGTHYPNQVEKMVLKWSQGDSIWLRRSAILFQLKYKQHTDSLVLGEIIERNTNSKEFFINKAIGWALREYSKTNPLWVRTFIANHHLSPLSIREGSKYL